jgi:Zn-dependent peptidase ImmA (M78 family)
MKKRTWSRTSQRSKLPYGFKADCERIAREVRLETGLDKDAPLDVVELARHLGIRLIPLSVAPIDPEARSYFSGPGEGEFSAVTLFIPERVIIFNDSHWPQRQRSDIAHELAHALLLHAAGPPLTGEGRKWDAGLELQAAELAGHLLVPKSVGIRCATAKLPVNEVAHEFGVSPGLLEWRIRMSGGRRIVARRPSPSAPVKDP